MIISGFLVFFAAPHPAKNELLNVVYPPLFVPEDRFWPTAPQDGSFIYDQDLDLPALPTYTFSYTDHDQDLASLQERR